MKFEINMHDSNAKDSHESGDGSYGISPRDSLVGKLLVASTTMEDPVLSRAVCLVVHEDLENVIAVLLNRPMTPPPGLVKMLEAEGAAPTASPDANTSTRPRFEVRKAKPFSQNEPSYRSQFAPEELSDPSVEAEAFGPNHDSEPEVTSDGDSPQGETPEGTAEMAEQIAQEASKALGMIHFGGPLSGPVVAVHNSRELAEAEAGRGVYVAARKEILERLVQHRPDSLRLIVGHLGWSTEQLADELQAGLWHVLDATEEDVFAGDHTLWPGVIRRATTRSMTHWLKIDDVPFASEVN